MSISNNLITLIICIYLLVSPFLFIHGSLSPYELPKFTTVLVTGQIIAILFLFARTKFKFDLLTKLIFVYLLIVLGANLLGLDPRTSLLGSTWRYQGFLLLLAGVIFYVSSRYFVAEKKLIELSIILSGFILSVFTIMEHNLLTYGYNFPTYNGRIVATMGNPNFLAGYILLVIPFVLYSKSLGKIKYAITIFCTAAIFITESRSAILASIIIISIYLFQKLRTKKEKMIVICGTAIIGLILILQTLIIMYTTPIEKYKLDEFARRSYCFYLIPENKTGNFIRVFYETHPELLKRTSLCENRFIIWNEGIKAFFKKPILGYGQENYSLIFPKKLQFTVDNAHNFFIETLISSGIVGLIAIISILYLGFRKTLFKYKLFLMSFLIVSFFNPLFITGIILFWITLGLSNNESVSADD